MELYVLRAFLNLKSDQNNNIEIYPLPPTRCYGGPTCIKMVAKHYGKNINIDALRNASGIGKEGVNLLGIAEAGEAIGFRTQSVQLSFQQLQRGAKLPCIAHWGQQHFVVVFKITKNGNTIHIADPAKGTIKYNKQDFYKKWVSDNSEAGQTGIVLLLEWYWQHNWPCWLVGFHRFYTWLNIVPHQ